MATVFEEDLIDTIKYLKITLNLDDAEIGGILTRHSSILKYSSLGCSEFINCFILYFGDTEVIRNVVLKCPKLLGYKPETLFIKLNELRGLLDFSVDELGQFISKDPKMCTYSVKNLKSKIEFLNKEGIEGEGLKKIVMKYPQILTYSVETKLSVNVEYLKKRLGLRQGDVCRLLTGFPPLAWLRASNLGKSVVTCKNLRHL